MCGRRLRPAHQGVPHCLGTMSGQALGRETAIQGPRSMILPPDKNYGEICLATRFSLQTPSPWGSDQGWRRNTKGVREKKEKDCVWGGGAGVGLVVAVAIGRPACVIFSCDRRG